MKSSTHSAAPHLRPLVLLLALAAALWPASTSSAHEQKTALTDIYYNERSGHLEVAHRFSLHDAEHALHRTTGSTADLALSPSAREAFAKYVAGRFALRFEDKDKTKLKLTLVGQELERGYLWVYQETKIPDPASAPLMIENTALQDAVKGQVNTVNVRYRSKVTTFVFKAGTGRKRYAGPAGAAKVTTEEHR